MANPLNPPTSYQWHKTSQPTYRALRDLHHVMHLHPKPVNIYDERRRPHHQCQHQKATAIQRRRSEEALRRVYERQLLLYLDSYYDDLEDIQDASDDDADDEGR
ncbi:hypothetical protein CERZMDRAFT_97005 [Cercospora zeae-maydis SCOH1-5]|uniref:Uncharacterized protein n=1 Tax=Cercospora zeae-maydis SCOH1-5 TaxID=717836 RepID=A0A6A6FIQ4_9PEZI|nr:hypothetical protein CERZMDRAFT_97005 [Cercospora zeae-maydis SCOH1-5]